MNSNDRDGWVRVRGARENNLANINLDVPRDCMVAFTGISGSGKSSLAFGTLYAEAQRRYFESVAPYARRLLNQVGAPDVTDITGLPPAVALQQRRGAPSSRSSVGTITTLSNLLRMLYSRAGTYPAGVSHLSAEAFSPNTVAGACPRCHGLGVVHDVTEDLLVPDDSLSIRDGAIAAWPGAWQGANLKSIVNGLGIDTRAPWNSLSRKDRDWLLYTEEQPSVFIQREEGRIDHGYNGKFWSARKHIMNVLSQSQSERMRERALRFVQSMTCPECGGSGLQANALSVTFAGLSIAELNQVPLTALADRLREGMGRADSESESSEGNEVAHRIGDDVIARVDVLLDLGLGYLSLGRNSTTLSPGEAQRLRIATQLRSGLFGVVYVLDEPSAGLHPADAAPLLKALDRLTESGNSLFVVEHDLDVIRRADWIVDIGPGAGEGGGQLVYSGPVDGLKDVPESVTGRYLFPQQAQPLREVRTPESWVRLDKASLHNIRDLTVDFPLGVMTAVTGVSGSGKSTLVTQVLAQAVRSHLGAAPDDAAEADDQPHDLTLEDTTGLDSFDRLVLVDQRPIGRTPRSNLATYTGMFDVVRKLFAATDEAQKRGYTASRFSFNVAGGRCETCQGEGFVSVELLFLPGTYAPCHTCHGARYNDETLEVTYLGKNIAEVLGMTVNTAADFFAGSTSALRSLDTLRDVGLGYLRLGQPATELSGGEAQRIKLATELQRARRGHALYLLDEPTSGLHPSDTELLLAQLQQLVDAGNTVVLVEHDLATIAASDWVIDLGPSGGDKGGTIVATGTPREVAAGDGATAKYLSEWIGTRAAG
ncbi:excinuclease ABC subunit UvrA [Salinibacterium sp. NSLL150]|uniref:excinuclease ABC subunit UvrA n=1 Tax=unclassified Salinibacterium TaxID=2632331 RepID=UPI0018CE4451|nr:MULTISPECIES: excinuclease ABC subunit UvrA [unclassified Salinibacterium]MBH0099539.1 excinuclease ABC subunit UvrA [Salinibacterium sp. NSLL35]MBH0102293.1 excinuclease ABC subunit UvrA [Salinibacterium sp. NSLL150]MBH0105053.1 excinuclease ABC subunit UvrA [Salinibacterium sp. NSLL16]MBH0107813.1 excinuclease ABC subunit UvrA [Salinibacterium sp. NSLL17]